MAPTTTILKFKEFVAENTSSLSGLYVVVKNDKVELRRMNSSSALQRFASGATFAILSGDTVQVNLKTGKTVFYKLTSSGNSVSGPYIK